MLETNRSELGIMKIADEVLGIVAGIAILEVEGVAAMSGGLVGGIAEMLGRKNLSKGIKLDKSEQELEIEVNIIVEFAVNIPRLTGEVQRQVVERVEKITGARVAAVNVNIEGVHLPEEERDTGEEEQLEKQSDKKKYS